MRTAFLFPSTVPAEGAVDAHRLGIAFGVLLGSWHLAWAIAVLLGWAQTLIDCVFWLHFIEPPYQVRPFAWPQALGLIAVTSGIGYLLGYFAGKVWARLESARR